VGELETYVAEITTELRHKQRLVA
jgi:chromosome segregation ATPase